MVVDAHRLDDMRPYLCKTADFGRSWRRLDGGLPADVYLHAVREDPDEPGSLYVGTERGVAYSRNDGASWRSLKLNLPTVAVPDLQVAGGSLVLGTNGRSVWIFDDLALLRQLTPEATAGDVHLFASPEAVRWEIADAHRGNVWTGDNPPHGARLYYFLKEEPKSEVKIEIRDSQGTLVTTLSSEPGKPPGASENAAGEEEALKKLALPKEVGVNRATWNLTWAGAEMIQGGILDAGDPSVGPAVLPGTYTARLSVGDHTETTTLVVEADPRETVSDADRAAQLRNCLALRDAITRLTRTVDRLRAVRKQLTDRNDLLSTDAGAETAPLRTAASALIAKLDALEARLHNPKATVGYDILAMRGGAQLYSRLSLLLDAAEAGAGAPTQGQREVFAAEAAELEGDAGELEALFTGDLAALNRQAEGLGVPTVWAPPATLSAAPSRSAAPGRG